MRQAILSRAARSADVIRENQLRPIEGDHPAGRVTGKLQRMGLAQKLGLA